MGTCVVSPGSVSPSLAKAKKEIKKEKYKQYSIFNNNYNNNTNIIIINGKVKVSPLQAMKA